MSEPVQKSVDIKEVESPKNIGSPLSKVDITSPATLPENEEREELMMQADMLNGLSANKFSLVL